MNLHVSPSLAVSSAFVFLSLCCLMAGAADSPQASARTNAQNYKDMVLATCVVNAYKGDKHAS